VNINPNIQILIDYQKKEIREIENKLKKSLTINKAHPNIQIMLKHLVADLRDSLDYLGYQIYQENLDLSGEVRVHFPILSQSKEKFDDFMNNNFPNLKTKNLQMFSFLEKIQYYNNSKENAWMNDITFLNNHYEHKNFLEHELKLSNQLLKIGTKKGFVFSIAKGATLRLQSLSIEDVGIEDATFSYDSPDPQIDGLVLKRTTENQFHFVGLKDENGNSKPVMGTLRGIFRGVQKTVEDINNL